MATGTESGGISPFTGNSTPIKNGVSDENTPPEKRQTKICVYCGSAPGTKPEHMEAARQLARVMAANNIGLGIVSLNLSTNNRVPCK